MMHKNILILIVVAFGAMLFLGGYKLFALTSDTGNTGRIVQLEENGFYPSEISIGKGDTITFTSKLGRYFWPASDIHPIHEIYPEFDPQEPIGPGKVWSFRFDKVGTFKYHDHLAPYFIGTIKVLDKNKKDVSSNACEQGSSLVTCWQETLLSVLDKEGVDAAFDRLATLYNEESQFRFYCHSIAHSIGLAAFSHFLLNKDSVLTPKAAFCANGFYHGFMEAFLSANSSTDKAREFCAYVDEKLSSQAPDAALQCYHGIGHGAMDMATRLKGPGKDERALIEPALKLCEEASDTQEQLYRCASGVFNGIANFYVTSQYGLAMRKEDPLWLCKEQPEEHKESCYGNMNTALYWLAGNNFPGAMRYIEDMEDKKQAVSAIRYLAGLAAVSEGKNISLAIGNCRSLQEHLRLPCIQGFVQGFLEHGEPSVEYKEALHFCRSKEMAQDEKEVCFQHALNLGGWYPKEKVQEICKGVEEEYRKFCE